MEDLGKLLSRSEGFHGRFFDQFSVVSPREGKPQYLFGISVDDRGKIEEGVSDFEIGEVGEPDEVRLNRTPVGFIIAHTHPDYKKKAKSEKDTVVHIYHHVDKPETKGRGGNVSFTEMIWAEAARRRKEALAKMAAEGMSLEEES